MIWIWRGYMGGRAPVLGSQCVVLFYEGRRRASGHLGTQDFLPQVPGDICTSLGLTSLVPSGSAIPSLQIDLLASSGPARTFRVNFDLCTEVVARKLKQQWPPSTYVYMSHHAHFCFAFVFLEAGSHGVAETVLKRFLSLLSTGMAGVHCHTQRKVVTFTI